MATFATIPPDVTPAEWQADPKVKAHPGRAAFQRECAQCHTMGDPSTREKMMQPAPDLFAWGSSRWTAAMLREPSSVKKYGYLESEQKMPSFAGRLSDRDVGPLRNLEGRPVVPVVSRRCPLDRIRNPGFPLNERQNHQENGRFRLVFP